MSGRSGQKREKLFKRIVGALDAMPHLLRQAFVLRHYKGFSENEIAAKVGVKAEEVSSLLRRAGRFLYQHLG